MLGFDIIDDMFFLIFDGGFFSLKERFLFCGGLGFVGIFDARGFVVVFNYEDDRGGPPQGGVLYLR